MEDESTDHSMTDSDIFADGEPSPITSSPKRTRKQINPMVEIKPKISSIHETLKGTNRNLQSVDRMLSNFRNVNENQLDSMERLRLDLNKTMDELKEERVKSSLRNEKADQAKAARRRQPTRGYESDSEYGGPRSRGGGAGIRFDTGSNDQIHEIHSSLRDLTAEHEQMKESLNREISRRSREEETSKRNMSELSDNVKRSTHDTSSSVEKRLMAIQDELKTERRYTDQKRTEMGRLSTELRQAIEDRKNGVTSAPPVLSADQVRTMLLDSPAVNNLTNNSSQPATVSFANLVRHKNALSANPPTVQASIDDAWRQKVSSAEMNRKHVENELETLKRKFDQSEGSRTALMRQIDELRNQLSMAERERTQLRNKVEEMKSDEEIREKKRTKAVNEERESERRVMEKEIEELKIALTRSTQQGSSEMEEIKRILDRTDRQKSQLQDQTDMLKRDVDVKEKQTLKLMEELQETKTRFDECERQRNNAMAQLEDAVRQLRDSTRDVSSLTDNLKSTERQLTDTEKKKEEMRVKAQETVKMWKMKCKRVEKDLEKLQQDSSNNSQKADCLTRENEGLKVQNNTMCVQLENMKREMADILSIRAQQEEQLRVKDNELCDLKGCKIDLEKEIRECRCANEKLREDVHACEVTMASMRDDKLHLDDKLSSVQAAAMVAGDENKMLRKEIQEVSTQKAEVTAQLNEVLNQRQELKRNLADLKRTEHELREDISAMTKQMKEESDFHQSAVSDLRDRMTSQRERDGKTVQDLAHRLKRDKAEYEAQIQALKIELAEERANGKILKRQDEKYKIELEKVHEQLNSFDDENARLRRRLVKSQKEMESKLQNADDDITRARKVEEDLLSIEETKRKQKRDFVNILHSIGSEINGVVEAASFGAVEAYEAITSNTRHLPNDPQAWLAEMKSKLAWLRSEILDQQTRERRLKLSVKDVVDHSEQDRRTLLHELHKHQDVVVDLLDEKEALEHQEQKKLDEVLALEEQVLELSYGLKQQQEDTARRAAQIEKEKRQIASELDGIKESQREKDRIHDRYERLQSMVSSLRQELSDTKHLAHDYSMDKLDADRNVRRLDSLSSKRVASPAVRTSSPISRSPLRAHSPLSHSPIRSYSPPLRASSPFRRSKSPTSRRRVRIRDSGSGDYNRASDRDISPTRDRSRSPARLETSPIKTPTPLEMSDEEFKRKFIPKPHLTDSIDDL